MTKEAELNAVEDKKRRDAVETRNQLDSSVYQLEKTLKEAGDKLPAEKKSKVEGALADAKKALESNDGDKMKTALDDFAAAGLVAGLGFQFAENTSPTHIAGPADFAAVRPLTPQLSDEQFYVALARGAGRGEREGRPARRGHGHLDGAERRHRARPERAGRDRRRTRRLRAGRHGPRRTHGRPRWVRCHHDHCHQRVAAHAHHSRRLDPDHR